MVKMGQPIEEFIRVMQDAEEYLQDMKDMISREPVGPNEN